MSSLNVIIYLIELLKLWVEVLKLFLDWRKKCFRHRYNFEKLEEESEMSESESPSKKRKVEVLYSDAEVMEATCSLTRAIDNFQELLDKIVDQINKERDPYSELLTHIFSKVPESRRLTCFIACMEVLQKFKND